MLCSQTCSCLDCFVREIHRNFITLYTNIVNLLLIEKYFDCLIKQMPQGSEIINCVDLKMNISQDCLRII